jgi:Putative zinc ribbon domain
MPLITEKVGDCRGSESDGSKSEKWCSLCYENGAFIDPDCTLEEMVTIVDRALQEQGAWFGMRWMARKQIPSLERWR